MIFTRSHYSNLILFTLNCHHLFIYLLYSIKSGKVVVVLAGRFAGRKAVVVKASDEGNEIKKFGHALGN